jgi:ATP-dependent protease ClpP protease subunit
MKQFGFALSEAGESLDLDIYSVIGESFWFDAVSAGSVLRRLKGSEGKAKTINVNIHSDGGDIFEASDIYFQLAEHSAKKVVRIGGLAASAASFVAMVGDEIIMGPAAWMMIHHPWGGAQGSAEKLIGWGETLLKARETYAAVYAARSKQSQAKCLEIMAAETWLTAEEAVKLGFADRIEGSVTAPAEAKVKARAQRAFAAASLNDFSNVPEAVKALMTSARGELEQERQPAPAPAPQQTPPAPEARQTSPALGEENTSMALSKLIITALALAEDADESTATAAIKKLQASAKVGAAVEELLGVSGQAALGAVRALKEGNEANAALGTEVAKLKMVNVRREFDGIVAAATKPDNRKLTPAMVKMYTERFDKAVKLADGDDGDADAAAAKAQDICEDLRGFVAIAPRVGSGPLNPPASGSGGSNGGGSDGSMQHGGKTFEAMAPRERLHLKQENPDLYNAMREDAQARGAI